MAKRVMTEKEMAALPDFVWKLVADWTVGGDAVYVLARYRVDRKWKRLVRDPEHQDWSFHSRSTAELMLKAEAAGEAYGFWSEPMHNAPQVIDLSVTELQLHEASSGRMRISVRDAEVRDKLVHAVI